MEREKRQRLYRQRLYRQIEKTFARAVLVAALAGLIMAFFFVFKAATGPFFVGMSAGSALAYVGTAFVVAFLSSMAGSIALVLLMRAPPSSSSSSHRGTG